MTAACMKRSPSGTGGRSDRNGGRDDAAARRHHERLCIHAAIARRPAPVARFSRRGSRVGASRATFSPGLAHRLRQGPPECRGFRDITIRDGASAATFTRKCSGFCNSRPRTNPPNRRANPGFRRANPGIRRMNPTGDQRTRGPSTSCPRTIFGRFGLPPSGPWCLGTRYCRRNPTEGLRCRSN
jgi:hypothetical protein